MHFRVFCGTLVTDGQRYTNVAIRIEKGRIVSWERFDPHTVRITPPDVDARERVVAPGMIDIHIHGGGGRDLMEGTPDAVQAVAKHLLKYGVTGFLVTPLTAPWDAIRAAFAAAREVRQHGSEGAQVLGCHLEGPFINPKRAGAQPPEYIVPPSLQVLEEALGSLIDELRIITLAPELEGSEPLVRALVQAGVIVSIGHTDADYDAVTRAIDWGARHATHCFNAMRPLHHREPGTVGAVLTHPELKAELIWDNVHTHPAVAQMLVQAKGVEGVICISDGVAGAGMPDGYEFELWGHRAVVSQGKATLVENGSLAGSVIGMDTCWRHATQRFNGETASMLCAYNPARALGLEGRKGTLRPGADADLAIWNPACQQVESTWIAGICKYTANP
ncbi:N-acetylglucosamine-6-phosphate deacetylase [Armatimonadetes bacterium GBS]|jgi:N-acetylglucosamine-6-phosphate deacetylase|nr:N-acetylglucosamine-6-phosphate deacetylase [bacterium HR14]GIV13566.1 MAG: N-acetylglucosamine-6-phosphate deacetylase [Fimbriimonadales bacterium]CUU07686.1 N-acetylglucosamine-6-phosphate deacetylase [Armatimonadetes bacterium GBS]CUU35419.1 N-acetylglucosamine-6-phosphate deacetylase [Armatimonadetes bacterium GXS]